MRDPASLADILCSLACVAACTVPACVSPGVLTPAASADLRAAEADVLEALPVACVVADAIDPLGMTAICAVVDTADSLLTAPAAVKMASPAAAAALVKAHPASARVTITLRTVDAMRASGR